MKKLVLILAVVFTLGMATEAQAAFGPPSPPRGGARVVAPSFGRFGRFTLPIMVYFHPGRSAFGRGHNPFFPRHFAWWRRHHHHHHRPPPAVPLPAALPLFGASLLGLAVFGAARRRKEEDAI